jgi:H+/Cl- antiporter ClcA
MIKSQITNRIIKNSIISGLLAVIIGFLFSYFLSSIPPDLIKTSLLFFGIHGIIYGIIFSSLNVTIEKVNKCLFSKYPTLCNMVTGTISGSLSCLPYLYLSWIGFNDVISQTNSYIPRGTIENELSELYQLLLIYTLLGTLVGFVVGQLSKKSSLISE